MNVSAQVTKVRGIVLDSETGDPLPFVSVFFEGTTIGISTDLEGRYYLETTDNKATYLQASLMGYKAVTMPVSVGSFSEINFSLPLDSEHLTAAVIKPDNKRLKEFLRLVDKNRERHNPYMYPRWSAKLYSKIELDATNADWLVENPLLKKTLVPITSCKDTSVVTGVEFYPILLSETASTLLHSISPEVEREIIEANHITGIDPDNYLTQFSGHYLFKANLYDSNIDLFNLRIPSPIASYGHAFYDYYLVDSLMVDGRKTYCLRFHPKPLVTSPSFDGQIEIDAADYAIRSARIRLSDKSNVNWIRHIDYSMDYICLPSGKWFPKEESVFVDFSIAASDSSKVVSFLGNKRQFFDTPTFDVDIPEKYLNKGDPVITLPLGSDYDWSDNRPIPLSSREEKIVSSIQEIQSSSSYNSIYGLARSLVVGYVEWRDSPIGIGPWLKTVTFNPTEGIHIGTGFRTTRYFNTKIRLTGSIGYGFYDQKVKGAASLEYMIRRDKTRKLTAAFYKDFVQLGEGAGELSSNNMINSLMSHRNDRQSLLRYYGIDYEHELSRVLSGYIRAEHRRIFGNEQVPLILRNGQSLNYLDASQLHLKARLAWDERINRGFFEKTHIFTKYPVLSFDLIGGAISLDRLLQSQINSVYYAKPYFRGEITVNWNAPGTPVGFSVFRINAGRIWGSVPYTLLKLHEGNPGWFGDNTAFSCMRFFEFASDTWANFFIEHNFNGLVLGKIPIIKKLDWREIVSFKAAIGSISSVNMEESPILPIPGMQSLKGIPYCEASVGVSNILRLFRVDYAWRLTQRTDNGYNSCIKIGMDMKF